MTRGRLEANSRLLLGSYSCRVRSYSFVLVLHSATGRRLFQPRRAHSQCTQGMSVRKLHALAPLTDRASSTSLVLVLVMPRCPALCKHRHPMQLMLCNTKAGG